MKYLRLSAAFVGLGLVTSGACTLPAGDAAATRDAPLAAGCTELGPSVVSHACFHAENGPFQSVIASSNINFSGSTPNVNTTHAHYTITLPGALGSNKGAVKFKPGRSGDWAIFLDPAVSLQVLDAAGVARPVLLAHDIDAGDCSALSRVVVVNLSSSVTYRFVFGPSSTSSTVGLVLERVDDFNTFYFEDGDGDGFGNPDELILTACQQPAGFVTDDTDCDDTRSAVHPGTAEICDGLDNDCNAVIDDVPGGCSASAGAGPFAAASSSSEILSTGSVTAAAAASPGLSCGCDCYADPASCSVFYRDRDRDGFGNASRRIVACAAPPGFVAEAGDCNDRDPAVYPEAEEICDGVDNDCDGTVDILPDPLDEVIEHGCEHAELGPFASITAGQVGGATSPNVNTPHVAYVITLPADGAAFAGQVRYRPVESGDYALLVDPDVDVTVLDGSGAEVEIEEERDASACPALSRLYLVELEAGLEYRLVFGPTPNSEALLLIEEAAHEHEGEDDSGGLEFFQDGDLDGFGNPEEVVDACFAPPGYVEDASDCDDADAAVHPGAQDICDGVDNDCDGTVDPVCEQSP